MKTSADHILTRLAAARGLAKPQIDWLTGRGVPRSAIASPDVLVAERVVFGAAWFDFPDELDRVEGTPEAVILIVTREPDGLPFDLVAWSPRLNLVASWLRRASYLGDPLEPRLDLDGSARVWKSPLGWLQAGRRGLVIVDPPAAARELRHHGPFAGEDEAHARELRELFKRDVPRVVTSPQKREDAA